MAITIPMVPEASNKGIGEKKKADENDPTVEFALNQTQRRNRELPCRQSFLTPLTLRRKRQPQVLPTAQSGNLEDAVPMQDQYPVECDPFDRPVEEVVMQLFDDDPPANPPPTKRQKSGDQ